MLAKLRGQRRLFLIELLQGRLVLFVELRAGTDEVTVVALGEELLLGAQRVARVVDGLDPGKQPGIEIDGVLMRRELRRLLGLHLLQRVVGVGLSQGKEDLGGAGEQCAGALHGLDRVRERRFGRAIRDLLDLSPVLRHPLLEGRLEVAVLDPVEGRRLIQQRAFREEGVGVRRGVGGLPGRGGLRFGGVSREERRGEREAQGEDAGRFLSHAVREDTQVFGWHQVRNRVSTPPFSLVCLWFEFRPDPAAFQDAEPLLLPPLHVGDHSGHGPARPVS